MSYVELHARSAFSFLRGASQPEHLVDAATQQGLNAMALCDRNGVYGAPRFYSAGQEQNFRALVGSELTLEDGTVRAGACQESLRISQPVPDAHPRAAASAER